MSEPLDIGEAYITDIQLTSGALPQGLSVNYTMSEPLQLKGTVWGAENPAGEYKAVFRIITSDYRCIAYTITVRVYGTVPYLDEYTIDLADGSAAVPQADFDQYIVRTLIYAMSNNELKFYLKQNKGKTEYLLLDLDKNDTWDISCVSDGGSPVFRLLDASSLTGDDYTFSLSDESIDEMNSDGVDMYARNLTFHLLDHYDLTIEGTEVTSRNREDILSDGVFSFDGGTILTINASEYNAKSKVPIIKSCVEGLRIRCFEDCSLSSSATILELHADTTMEGGASVVLNGSGTAAVMLYNGATLTVQNTTFYARGSRVAVLGSKSEYLKLIHSDVVLQGGDAAVSGLSTKPLTADRCQLIDPVLAVHDPDKYVMTLDGVTVKKLTYESYEISYDITVVGQTINNRNRLDVLRDGGSVSYDGHGTLYISGDIVTPAKGFVYGISAAVDSLQIVAGPDTTVHAFRMDALRLGKDCSVTITGGPLTLISDRGMGVNAPAESVVTIRDTELTAEGTSYGIAGNGSTVLRIEDSAVTARGGSAAVLGFSRGVTLSGARLVGPDGVTFSNGRSEYDEETWATEVVIEKDAEYPLSVCQTQVCQSNCEDILGDGVFSYDPEENVLHVKGDCVDRTATIIQSDGYGLTIMADVDCTLAMSPFAMGFVLDAKDTTVITGPGRLTMTGSYNPAVAQYFRGALKLQDADVTLSGESCALQGGGSAHETQLIVENSTLRASSQNEWASVVNNFSGGIRLNGCSIVTPDGASFSDKITDADGKDVTEVLISPMHISVAGGTMTCSLVLPADNRPAALIAAWYDASGRMLGSTQKPVTCTGKLETTITVPSAQAEYRLFTVDAATRAPLISQLTCK